MVLKKIHKLNYTPDYNFAVFGITSDEKDYKLIFDINKATGWNLERRESYIFFNPKTSDEQQFPLFTYSTEDGYISYKLISNKHDNQTLLDELKNLDYLLIIIDESEYEDLTSMPERLKKIKSIRAVFLIDPAKLKDKERLIFQ